MLNFVLPLLKNPLTRIVAEKTVGAITHKLEKDKIIKAKEIEAATKISVEQIRQQDNSFKDEWLVIFFTILMACHFIPYTQEAMQRGWEILELADPMFWYIILTIVGASFGVTTMNKIKKK
jgi:hypothetical protein|tara:strand:- start:36 stop:398 length:363 start_codon:yes stop_codon:yes gene_type:complete